MSKFIAILCAAAMLMSTATVAFADDTYEEPVDESYEESYDEYREESTEPDGTTEFMPGYTVVDPADDYIDTSETGIKTV